MVTISRDLVKRWMEENVVGCEGLTIQCICGVLTGLGSLFGWAEL